MKNRVKAKGSFRTLFSIGLYLGILMILVNVVVWSINNKSGMVMACFTAFYMLVMCIMVFYNKPVVMNELVSFATEYGQIQRKLLRELELPYVLLDEDGRVMWTNKAFEQLVHKGKGYNKSITSIFPDMTKDKLPGELDDTSLQINYSERDFQVRCRKIPLKDMAKNSDILQFGEDYNGYLIAVYFFEETALRLALRENDDQSLAVALLYLDNYDEALESVEEVRRIKEIVAEVKAELDAQSIEYGEVEQGIMIETPAAVMISDLLAEEVDFFSIGTNDLTQYTLAIDRQNEQLDDFYNPHHEAVLRMIRMVVENAHKCGKWAGICGELGADLTLTEQFVRMGVDELSVAPSMILKLRKVVREMKAEE